MSVTLNLNPAAPGTLGSVSFTSTSNTLMGNDGNDMLIGQLGNDSMTAELLKMLFYTSAALSQDTPKHHPSLMHRFLSGYLATRLCPRMLGFYMRIVTN